MAFSLPVLQKILIEKSSGSHSPAIRCIVLVPTKELMKQIDTQIHHLIYYCKEIVSVCSLSDDNFAGDELLIFAFTISLFLVPCRDSATIPVAIVPRHRNFYTCKTCSSS